MTRNPSTSFRFSPEVRDILKRIAELKKWTAVTVVEEALREFAKGVLRDGAKTKRG